MQLIQSGGPVRHELVLAMSRIQRSFLAFVLVFALNSSVQAIHFTIPSGPLRVSNTGFVLAPEQMVHQNEFATIREQGRIKHFTSILLSPNEPITVRFEDGVFRKVYFDSNSGKALLSSSGEDSNELTRQQTLNEMKDYFLALGMEKDPTIHKFLQNYFPGTEVGNGAVVPPINPAEGQDPSHAIEEGEPKPPRPIAPPSAVPPSEPIGDSGAKGLKGNEGPIQQATPPTDLKGIPAPDLFDEPTTPTEPTGPKPAEEKKPSTDATEDRDFECVKSQGGFRPQHKQFKKPLGADPMATQNECLAAVKASRNGVVCSFTGIGFKPTYLKGVTPSRTDYGYVGGSSMSFQDCLFATERSTSSHICFWGGSAWYATHPTGDKSSKGGPFNSLKACVDSYAGKERIAELQPPAATPPQNANPPIQTRGINPLPREENPKPQGSGNKPGPFGRPLRRLIDFFKPKQEPPKQSRITPSAAKGHELLGNNCMACHKPGGEASEFPSWLAQQGELERRLASQTPQERLEAQGWLRKLNQVLNLDKSMPPKSAAELRHSFLNNPESAKFKAWIAQQTSKLGETNLGRSHPPPSHTEGEPSSEGPSSEQPRPTADLARNAVQLLPPDKLNLYRSILPKVENPELDAILKDPNTLFFDKTSMVAGYQDPSTPVTGVRTTEQGFRGAGFASAATQLYLDNQGHLRMFNKGVGLDGTGNTQTFHFIHLPKDVNGNLQKIKVFKRVVPPDDAETFDWVFPVGTVSGEVVYNLDSSGKPQVLEVRTRKKDNSQGAWAPDIMRPFPTASSLSDRLSEVAQSNPALKAEAETLRTHLNNPNRLQPIQIKRDGFQKGNFESQGGTDVLPNMSEGMVKALLATPFKSTLGAEWDNNGGVTAFAPTTRQANGIVPQFAKTGATRVDRQSCNKCHEDSNRPINNFFHGNHPQFNAAIRAYGNLPGSDRNLRFTIFDPKYFSRFGNDSYGKDNRVIRKELLPILDFQR